MNENVCYIHTCCLYTQLCLEQRKTESSGDGGSSSSNSQNSIPDSESEKEESATVREVKKDNEFEWKKKKRRIWRRRSDTHTHTWIVQYSYASFRLLLPRSHIELYEYASHIWNWSDKFCAPAIWNSIILDLSHKYRTRLFITICLFYTYTNLLLFTMIKSVRLFLLLFWCWIVFFFIVVLLLFLFRFLFAFHFVVFFCCVFFLLACYYVSRTVNDRHYRLRFSPVSGKCSFYSARFTALLTYKYWISIFNLIFFFQKYILMLCTFHMFTIFVHLTGICMILSSHSVTRISSLISWHTAQFTFDYFHVCFFLSFSLCISLLLIFLHSITLNRHFFSLPFNWTTNMANKMKKKNCTREILRPAPHTRHCYSVDMCSLIQQYYMEMWMETFELFAQQTLSFINLTLRDTNLTK